MNQAMRECDEILELTSLCLDDELDEDDRKRLNRHMANCPDCAHLFTELRAVDVLFRQSPMAAAPEGFTGRAVNAAFEAHQRRNLHFGLLVLLLGTIVISSLVLLGHIDLLWMVASVLLAPGFFSDGLTWLIEIGESLMVAGRVGLTVLEILRNLLVGPLLVPSLILLLSTAFLFLVLRQSDEGTMTAT
ncbi:MAG: zf-HC2 domain-containing protein [Chloroflexota bacterium]|nr:zf-HC2 domain-containing protein [Chloroflexota bacterium]